MKSQVNQVFIYILTIVLVGIVLLVGYKAISGMFEDKCQTELAALHASLQRDIEKYGSFGSVNKKEYLAVCDYDVICFVSAEKNEKTINSGYDIMDSHVLSEDNENVFLIGQYTKPILADTKVFVSDPSGFVCFESANEKFKITFKGLGTKTQIEQG